MANALSDHHVNIVACDTATGNDRVAKMRFEFELADPGHLAAVLRTIKQIDGVYDAYRLVAGRATPVQLTADIDSRPVRQSIRASAAPASRPRRQLAPPAHADTAMVGAIRAASGERDRTSGRPSSGGSSASSSSGSVWRCRHRRRARSSSR